MKEYIEKVKEKVKKVKETVKEILGFKPKHQIKKKKTKISKSHEIRYILKRNNELNPENQVDSMVFERKLEIKSGEINENLSEDSQK